MTPFTLKERLLHIEEAKKTLGATVPWLCDTIDNDLKHRLGDRPNSEFVIDPDGQIIAMRDWSNPDALRADLEKLVGRVENPTRVADLKLAIETHPRPAASGVVKRVHLSGQGQPLVVKPVESQVPFYAKLRVEADRDLLRTGTGQLYLGFHLDPIYRVHWNNLARPLSWEVTTSAGIFLKPAEGTAPQVDVESDVDPREFVVEVELDPERSPFELSVRYFACSDEEGFCIPVTQKYVVTWQVDRDGGQARRSSASRGSGRVGNRGFTAERLMRLDANGDGKVSHDEMPRPLQRLLSRADRNGDRAIDEEEAKAFEGQNRTGSAARATR